MPYHKLRAADLNKDGRADIVTTNRFCWEQETEHSG